MTAENTHIVALILAGGKGNRVHSSERPKQFIETDGVPIIVDTLSAFQQHPEVDAIAVVCLPEWIEYVEEKMAQHGIHKFSGCFPSGESGFESLCHGIEGLRSNGYENDTIVLVHDAVRPFVSQQIISGNIETCRRHGNAITALRSEEAFARSADGLLSNGYLSRENIFRIQTPHTFRLGDIISACEWARQKGETPQSLYTLMASRTAFPLYMTPGEMINFKLTYPEDIALYRTVIHSAKFLDK
ncbi:MAG: 2-C-methyl-D-erythritol 4-phosphate cytidylyltransferase [Coprobacter sp.]|nr:2-C-methyl-D-erythritol 4-phosphate cytidylyltransferase [Coprobacter sp.]